MPKNKTHKGTAKRIRRTGSGKLRREQSGRRHYLAGKSSRLTRRLDGTTEVSASDTPRVRKLLGH